jgi:flagellar FliJ protein
MKKFRYRLQALLKVKEHIEKEKQKEHAVAMQHVHDQQDRLRKLGDDRTATVDKQREAMTGSLSVAEMLVFGRYLLNLKRQQVAEEELLKAARKVEAGKREKLLAATKERKIYDKHKEKQSEKFGEEVRLQETKENDEAAGNSHRLKKRT